MLRLYKNRSRKSNTSLPSFNSNLAAFSYEGLGSERGQGLRGEAPAVMSCDFHSFFLVSIVLYRISCLFGVAPMETLCSFKARLIEPPDYKYNSLPGSPHK